MSSRTTPCCGSECPSRTDADMTGATMVRFVVQLGCIGIWLLIGFYWLGVTRSGSPASDSRGRGLEALLLPLLLVCVLWIAGTRTSRVGRSGTLGALLP